LTTPLCLTVVALALLVPQPWFRGYGALFATALIVVGCAGLGYSTRRRGRAYARERHGHDGCERPSNGDRSNR
jgi:hypothetical protein